jgi:hypothetical protein
MDNHSHQDGEVPAGDFVVGADNIRAFLVSLGLEGADPYYLKRRGWPIGNTSGDSGKLIASKRRLTRYVEKLAAA